MVGNVVKKAQTQNVQKLANAFIIINVMIHLGIYCAIKRYITRCIQIVSVLRVNQNMCSTLKIPEGIHQIKYTFGSSSEKGRCVMVLNVYLIFCFIWSLDTNKKNL